MITDRILKHAEMIQKQWNKDPTYVYGDKLPNVKDAVFRAAFPLLEFIELKNGNAIIHSEAESVLMWDILANIVKALKEDKKDDTRTQLSIDHAIDGQEINDATNQRRSDVVQESQIYTGFCLTDYFNF